MAFVDHAAREINCKVVYEGPGLVGKYTNLHHIYTNTPPEARGKMVVLANERERTMFVDVVPRMFGTVDGYRIRFHLYTVPGALFFNASRSLILKGVDGVVLVADSHAARMDANLEALVNLERNLADYGRRLADLSLVFQYNKRDAPNITSIAELDAALNPGGRPRFAAQASRGIGVFDTVKEIARQVVVGLREP